MSNCKIVYNNKINGKKKQQNRAVFLNNELGT